MERFFTIPVHELFGYCTDPRLIEKWCAPEGMTLKVHMPDVRAGGRYRYEHTHQTGKYVCEGHFRKIIQNKLLRMVDDEIRAPSGEIVGSHLTCDMKFVSFGSGSAIQIEQSGFKSEAFANECRRSWEFCLDQLQDLVKDSGLHQFTQENRKSA
jgi:uncharacterized protein YndB with AHSA1/START domain